MDDAEPQPTFFVCRDRARRYGRRLREALEERRLAYRGADIGMETLSDSADPGLKETLAAIAETETDLEERRIRDRERGYMEVPLLVMGSALAIRIVAARRLEAKRRRGRVEERPARAAILELFEDGLDRVERYCAAYDEKRPVGPSRLVELARLLERVERHRTFGQERLEMAGRAYDRVPPTLRSDDAALEDLVRIARGTLEAVDGPWRVEVATPTEPMRLSLGATKGDGLELPDDLARAQALLSHLHPVSIELRGQPERAAKQRGVLSEDQEPRPARVTGLTLTLADPTASGRAATLTACAGDGAQLTADTETAVRRLLEAPPLTLEGQLPPQRMVALMGLLKAVDDEIRRVLIPGATTPRARVAASQLPREKTRKAPPRADLVHVLEQDFPGFPSHRLDAVATAAADGKLARGNANAADAAALVAVTGRTWRFGGRDFRGALPLADLEPLEVEMLIQELVDVAQVRRDLEAGKAVDPLMHTRLERSSIGILGRLGRVQ